MNRRAHTNAPNRALDRIRIIAPLFVWALLVCAAGSSAQDNPLPPPPLPVDPTPLEDLLTAEEKEELKKSNDPKKLVDRYLEIADDHLDAALDATNASDIARAERELDIYNKIVTETAQIAFSREDKKRRLSKKIEQRLFKQIKMLETIERLFPLQRAVFAEAALKHARQTRIQALNTAFASGDILKDPEKQKRPDKSNPPNYFMTPLRRDFASSGARPASQIPGDYLNEEEDDHVRRAQKPDERTKVFMKIADRRLAVITGNKVDPSDKKAMKKAEEEEREWGPLPKLSRAESLRHYARAIEEVVAKLEDAHERNPKSSDLPRALSALRDSTDRHLQILRSLSPEVKDEAESRALATAIEQAEMANRGAREGLKGR